MTDLATRIADVKQKAQAAIKADDAMKAATDEIGFDAMQLLVKSWLADRGAYSKAASPDLFLAMAARIEELEKALEPFADAWNAGGKRNAAPKPVDFRTAARALKGEG